MITLEEIKQEIQKEKEKYTKPYEKDKGFEMCKEFSENNHFTKGEHLLQIDIWECFKCLLYLKSNRKFTLEECERLRRICEMTLGPLSGEEITKTISILLIISENDDKDKIIEYINESNSIIASAKLALLKQPEESLAKKTNGYIQDEEYKDLLKSLRNLHQKVGVLDEIEQFIIDYPAIAIETFAFISLKKQMEDGVVEVEEEMRRVGYLTSRERNKFMSHLYSQFYSVKPVTEASHIIQRFIYEEERKEQETSKENQRMQRIYGRAEAQFENIEGIQEITNPRDYIRGIPNEKIKKDILLWIYNHNKEYYNRLEEELEDLSSKSINQYFAVLGRYNISLHPKDIPTISHNTPEEIEEILSSLPVGTYEKEDIILILQGTTSEIAKRIKKYIDLGYISRTKVMENISLFFHEDKKLDRMAASIEIINAQGINPKIFRGQPEYYWTNNDLLNHNLMVLSTYNLAKNLKNIENFDFLLEDQLEEKIDMWIELGFYSFLEQNLGLLNQSRLRIKRFYLLKQMNIPVEDLNMIEDVLENPKFIVSDRELKDYIMDYASLEKPCDIPFDQERLENFGGDKISFTIEGEIFSIPKIKRRIEQGDSMWNAMFYGKKITEEDYKKVMSILVPNTESKK